VDYACIKGCFDIVDYTAPMNYTDAILYGNLIENIDKDVRQTYDHRIYADKNNLDYTEYNPLVRGVTDNLDVLKIYGAVSAGLLGKRWGEMQDSNQRQIEMIIANLIEAKALSDSKADWQLQYGVNF